MSKNVVTLKSGQRSLKVVESGTIRQIVYGFVLVFFTNFVPKSHSTGKYTMTMKPWSGSLKVIENDSIRSGTQDLLLTFHTNYRPISHCFRDKRRFPLKIANFSHPVYL